MRRPTQLALSQTHLGRIQVRRVSGQPEHPQPGLRVGEGAQLGTPVHIEVVPHQHDVPAGQLAVRGDQQVPVLGPGERLSGLARKFVGGRAQAVGSLR